MWRLGWTLTLQVVLASATSSDAAVVYVRADAPSGGNGASWSTAYSDLAVAMQTAPANSEIWVARGTYSPGTTATATFPLRAGVSVFGGFAGAETQRSDRDVAANPTLLDGQSTSLHVVTVNAGGGTLDGVTIRGGNTNGVVCATSSSGAAVLAVGVNFALRNCAITENVSGRWCTSDSAGSIGAVALTGGAHATIDSCVFSGNVGAKSNVYIQQRATQGGAIGVRDSSVAIVNSVFVNNRAGNGNVDRVGGGGGYISAPGGDGGAIYADGADLTLIGCVFHGNSAGIGGEPNLGGGSGGIDTDGFSGGGGGAIYAHTSLVVIRDCDFLANRSGRGANDAASWTSSGYTPGGSGGQGGAIALDAPRAGSEIVRTRFIGNLTGDGGRGGRTISQWSEYAPVIGGPGGDGGAIWIRLPTSLLLYSCQFLGNVTGSGGQGSDTWDPYDISTLPPGDGGRGGDGGGVFVVGDGKTNTVAMANCLFASNRTGIGAQPGSDGSNVPPRGQLGRGGNYAAFSGTKISASNCTIAFNDASGSIGGVRLASIANAIVWSNSDSSGEGLSAQLSDPALARACIVSGIAASGPAANMNSDPRFILPNGLDGVRGTEDDDYRLAPGSPAIDSGNNFFVALDAADLDGDGDESERVPFDLAEEARFANDAYAPDTGVGTPPLVDRGAFEKPVTPCTTDLNNDQRTDAQDVLIFVDRFDQGLASADWNSDGFLSFEDCDLFVQQCEAGC